MLNKKLAIILFLVLLIFVSAAANLKAIDTINKEIVVYSAEPEGVIAAVAAAREGKKVLLVMNREKPGGLMTYASLNFLDLNYNNKSENINQGIFSEWHKKVGSSISFSPQKAEEVFLKMIKKENNIEVIKLSNLKKVVTNNKKIKSILIKKNEKEYKITADIFIDASQDGDLAALAGENYFIGTEDIGVKNRWMASTQILKYSNVKPNLLKKAVKNNKYRKSYFRDNHAWGFLDFSKKYQSKNSDLRLRGLNIVFIEKENGYDAYINALLLFGIDPLSEKSINLARKKAKKEAKFILEYLSSNLEGFKNAKLSDLPKELYRRESRHFLTEYQLGVKDQFNQKIFKDTITLASYPLDYQAASAKYPGFVLFNPEYYSIPLRSLIAKKNKNLLIVGRSSGYTSLAAASARVLPVGMNTAEAASLAAVEAVRKEKSLLDIAENQESLTKIRKKLGINIDDFPHKKPIIADFQSLSSLEKLLSWGITIGGYENSFKLNKTAKQKDFTAIILKIMQKKDVDILYEWVPGSLETLSKNRNLTANKALMLLLAAESQKVLEIDSKNYYNLAENLNLIPKYLKNKFKEKPKEDLTQKEMIILAAHYLDRFETPAYLSFIRGENID